MGRLRKPPIPRGMVLVDLRHRWQEFRHGTNLYDSTSVPVRTTLFDELLREIEPYLPKSRGNYA